MPLPSRSRSSASEIPSDPIMSDGDDDDRHDGAQSPASANKSEKPPLNSAARNFNNRSASGKDYDVARNSNSKRTATNTIKNGVSSPSHDVEMQSVEDVEEEEEKDLELSEPTGSSGPSEANASVIDLAESQPRTTFRSRPMTRSQARASKTVEPPVTKSSPPLRSSREESPADLRSSSESDFSPVLTRRPRRAAALKATVKFSNDERADKALSKLLERAQSDADYTSILAKWRDPGSRATLIANMDDSSASSEDAPAHRIRLTKYNAKSRANKDVESMSSREDPADKNLTRNSSVKSAHRAVNVSNIVDKLRSNRRQSMPLRRNGGTLQDRLRNRPGLSGRPAQGSTAATARSNLTKRRARSVKSTRLKKRARRSQRSAMEASDIDDESSEGNSAIEKELGDSEEEMDFAADADEEEEILDQGDEADVADDDDDDDDPGENSGLDDEDVLEVDVAESEEEDEPTPRRRLRNTRSAKNRNGRRRRTAPSDAFSTNRTELTDTEKKERLEFLLNQSSEIARSLHQALAETPMRQPSRGPGQSRTPDGGTTNGNEPEDEGEMDSTKIPKSPAEEEFVLPNGQGCELQPHQMEGVSWLLKLDAQGLNAILADEMGLGKTIQAVAFLASLILSGSRGPHLVIAPKTVCEHWVSEVKMWYPSQITVVSHLGPAEERIENLHATLLDDNFDIMITSYEIAMRDLFTPLRRDYLSSRCRKVLREFREVEFEYLVVDEAHRLKSDKALINQAVRNYNKCQRRLLLTGTPLSNHLQELWSLLNILNPRIFSSKATFESWFSAPFDNAKGKKREIMTNAEKSLIVDRLHTVIRPFFRRRERKDVCPQFTSADEVVIPCPLSALQRSLMHHFQRRASEREAGVSNILMAMRGVSNHPYTTTEAFNEYAESDATPKLVATSGKFSFLHYALPRLIGSGHRILLFSQFRAVLDYLEDLLDLLGIKYGRLDGGTKSDERSSGIADFNAEGSDIPVFLLTTRAGGVGLNLQTADTVILFDSDWNPSADLQAVSRIQRIGQKKTVHILRLVSENSVDSLIVEAAGHKRRTQEVAVGAGNFHTSSGAARDQKLRQKDLEELLALLEGRKFLDELPLDQSDSHDDPNASLLNATSWQTRDARIADWDKKLLRPGEEKLAPSNVDHIWIDSTPDTGFSSVPKWLSKDADLVAAARAMRSRDVYQAATAYDEVVQSRARVGEYSKKERAIRARRHIVLDFSDYDSEEEVVESQSDGSVKIDVDDSSDSDNSIKIVQEDETSKSKVKSAKVSKVAKWAINLDSEPEDPPASPDSRNNSIRNAQPPPGSEEGPSIVPEGLPSSSSKAGTEERKSESPQVKTVSAASYTSGDIIEEIPQRHCPKSQLPRIPSRSPSSALTMEKKEADSDYTTIHEKITLYQRAQTSSHPSIYRSPQKLCTPQLTSQPGIAHAASKTPMMNMKELNGSPANAKIPRMSIPPQTITLPMIQISGKVDTITVEVNVEETVYHEARRLSLDAVKRAMSGDQTSAFIICSQVSKLLGQFDRNRAQSTLPPPAALSTRYCPRAVLRDIETTPNQIQRPASSLINSARPNNFVNASSISSPTPVIAYSSPAQTPQAPRCQFRALGDLRAPVSNAHTKPPSPLPNNSIGGSQVPRPGLTLYPPNSKYWQQLPGQNGKANGGFFHARQYYASPVPVIAPLLTGIGEQSSSLKQNTVGAVQRAQLSLPNAISHAGRSSQNSSTIGNPHCALPPLPPLLKANISHKPVPNIVATQPKRGRALLPYTELASDHLSQKLTASCPKSSSILPRPPPEPEALRIPKICQFGTNVPIEMASSTAQRGGSPNKQASFDSGSQVGPSVKTKSNLSVQGSQMGKLPTQIPIGSDTLRLPKTSALMPKKHVSIRDAPNIKASTKENLAAGDVEIVSVRPCANRETIIDARIKGSSAIVSLDKGGTGLKTTTNPVSMKHRVKVQKVGHASYAPVVIDLTNTIDEEQNTLGSESLVPKPVRKVQTQLSLTQCRGDAVATNDRVKQSFDGKTPAMLSLKLKGRGNTIRTASESSGKQSKGSKEKVEMGKPLTPEKCSFKPVFEKTSPLETKTDSAQPRLTYTLPKTNHDVVTSPKRQSPGISRRQTLVRAAVTRSAYISDSYGSKRTSGAKFGTSESLEHAVRSRGVTGKGDSNYLQSDKALPESEGTNNERCVGKASSDVADTLQEEAGDELEVVTTDCRRNRGEAKMPDLVTHLQSITNVTDSEVLVDALFASNGDLDSAVKHILSWNK